MSVKLVLLRAMTHLLNWMFRDRFGFAQALLAPIEKCSQLKVLWLADAWPRLRANKSGQLFGALIAGNAIIAGPIRHGQC
jgi:hypothetical protein